MQQEGQKQNKLKMKIQDEYIKNSHCPLNLDNFLTKFSLCKEDLFDSWNELDVVIHNQILKFETNSEYFQIIYFH